MSIEGCAFVCWILSFISAILYFAAWRFGSVHSLIPAAVCGLAQVLICGLVIVYKYCR